MKPLPIPHSERPGLFSKLPGEELFIFNEQALSIIGRDRLTLREFAELFHRDEREALSESLKELCEGDKSISFTLRINLYGEYVKIILSAQGRGGFVCGSVAFAESESLNIKTADENMSDEDLRMAYAVAQQNALAKSSYISDMSHEIRTPMNAILGLCGLLKNTGLDERQSDYNQKIEQAARALFRTVNNILDFSKLELGKLTLNKTPFVLDNILMDINTIVNMMAEEKGLSYSYNCSAEGLSELIGDPMRLNQVLINILHNAVQFTVKGDVRLAVSKLSEDGDSVNLQFTVSDTGVGMSSSQVEMLFSPMAKSGEFNTRKYGGNGISLIICKNLISLMSGEIWCESKVDVGSVFYFTAVFEKSNPDDNAVDSGFEDYDDAEACYDDSDESENAKVKILVVEDIDINRLVIDEILKAKGYLPEFATNGEDALSMLDKRVYDIVFMDIRMPVMDGLTATREIRRDPKYDDMPIIAMTAHATRDDRDRSMKSGMNSYITKPIEAELVYKALRHWVKRA